jgi:hypothetical protein
MEAEAEAEVCEAIRMTMTRKSGSHLLFCGSIFLIWMIYHLRNQEFDALFS